MSSLLNAAEYSNSSADGQYVAFGSNQDNLVAGDHNTKSDIFIRDTHTGATDRISMAYDGVETNGDSFAPSISSDGRYVVFSSLAGYLVEGDSNLKGGVFVYDRWARRAAKVSLGIDGAEGKGGYFDVMNTPSISPNGKYIMFYSSAWNLVPSDHNGIDDVFVTINPLFVGDNSVPSVPSDLIQRNESDGKELVPGKIINEGTTEGADSIILSAKVQNPKGGRVALEIYIESVDEVSGVWTSFEPIRSEYVQSGEVATIDYTVPKGGLYTWRAKTVNETGSKSDWAHFGDNGIGADFISSNFSFVFLTDVHLGSFTTAISQAFFEEQYYESQTYPRFTDLLYDIENLNPKPDFILIGGDNVEYNNERWLRDFKSITEGYSQRTGIEIYFVPGNHERYNSESTAMQQGEADISGGNDNLKNYFEVMQKPEGVTSLFATLPTVMEAEKSEPGGLNRYNYYFYHDGFQFIGLDSGEDTGAWDLTPESAGLSDFVMGTLEVSAWENSGTPKIIFMHSPVFDNDLSLPETDNSDLLGGTIVMDGAITNNWEEFTTYCDQYDIQLVLSGHTHESLTFNHDGTEDILSNWAKNKSYPFYLQTQSAGKGDNYGYGIVDVENGKAIPREPRTGVTKYEKIFADLDSKTDLKLLAYDGGGQATIFTATDSNRKIIYDDTAQSGFTVKNDNSDSTSYDLQMQKREAGAEIKKDYVPSQGYKIVSPELCKPDDSPECDGKNFVYLLKDKNYTILGFEDVEIKGNSSSLAAVNWDELSRPNILWEMDGLTFIINGNYAHLPLYNPISVTFTADLGSPGELRVYDKEGRITGLVNGEIVEDIPYSVYIPESETVYVFGDTRREVVEGLKTQVVGAYEETYDLSLVLSENNMETAKFTADDVLTDNQSTHQFSVDWEALEQGGDGVTMDFDESKDGVFEKSIKLDVSLNAPKAKFDVEKYTAEEGSEIIFDGSASSDSDGHIILYEWDFDGNGIYDATSVVPTIAHTYGDDFVGELLLKVTDNEGLKGVSSAQVTITNANPTAMITKFEMADIIVQNMIGEKSTDLDWLSANSSFGVADAMGKFILEGPFTDSGWLDTHSASVDWGDGNIENIQATEENISPEVNGNISASHKYTELKNYVVKLTVTDDDGAVVNSEITLESPKQIKQVALLRLGAIQTDNKNVRKEIDKAIGSLEESLSSKYWNDDFHLNLPSSPKFFSEEQKTIKSLEKILEDKKKNESFQNTQEIKEIVDELSQSDIFLAKIMVYDEGGLAAKNLKSAKGWVEEILGL